MLLAAARAATASMAAYGVAAAAVSCVAHSHSESCRDLVARAAAGVQLRCVSVRSMCGRRDWVFVECSPLACRAQLW
jgi:hypothetical protein